MDKKFGIMTFHQSYNCGSILQALALEKIIETCGYEAECINFSNIGQKNMYSILDTRNNFKAFLKNIVLRWNYQVIKKHFEDYQFFIDSFLKVSKESYTYTEELVGIEENYTGLIAGSDQVWNVKCYDADKAYFLSFAKNIKKIAYAPSLGAIDLRTTEVDISEYKKYLQDFDYLSCREKNGQSIIHEITNMNVELIADPTLLFKKEEWNKMVPTEDYIGKPFIFYYAFLYPDEVNKCVQKIAREKKFDVFIMDAKAYYLNALWRYGFKLTDQGGPREFIYRIKNSSIVLTTSFHGTVFSALYHKSFLFLNSSMHDKTDDRAITILQQLGLEKRYVSFDEVSNQIDEEIDYRIVDKNIEKLRQESVQYLKNALEGINNE